MRKNQYLGGFVAIALCSATCWGTTPAEGAPRRKKRARSTKAPVKTVKPPVKAPPTTQVADRATFTPEKARKLKVGMAGSEPFVMKGKAVRGLSVDVWKAVAGRLGIPFEVRRYKSVKKLLEALEEDRIQLAIGPISITAARATHVDFTQPYFSAGIGILANAVPPSTWSRIKPFLSRAFLVGSATLILVIFVVGNLIWLAERGRNPEHFPRRYVRGIGNAMWFALVTMTTVGYGDRVPITRFGRIISGIWMLIAMITASSLTAGIATALTLSQINSPAIASLDQLKNRKVAVVGGTPGEALARRFRARLITVESKEAGIELVNKGKAVAHLYDHPVLEYYVAEHPSMPLVVHRSKVAGDLYGFAVQQGDRLRSQINVTLLKMREAMELKTISRRWKLDHH